MGELTNVSVNCHCVAEVEMIQIERATDILEIISLAGLLDPAVLILHPNQPVGGEKPVNRMNVIAPSGDGVRVDRRQRS